MLEKEFQYYLDHQPEIVKDHEGKYLIIKDEEIVDVFSNKDEAYFKAKEKYELGTFLIQYCAPGNMAYTQTFYNQNVAF